MSQFALKNLIEGIKCILIYLAFAVLPVLIMVLMDAITETVCTGVPLFYNYQKLAESEDPTHIIAFMSEQLNGLPFGEIFEKLMEDLGIFTDVFTSISDLKNGAGIKLLEGNILIYVTKIFVANLLIYLFFRINNVISCLFVDGVAMKIGEGIAGIVIATASFSITSNVIDLLSHYAKEYITAIYIILAVASFLLRAKGLGDGKILSPGVLKYLLFEFIFGIINSFAVWLVCISYVKFFFSIEPFALILAFFICAVLLILEKEIQLRI